LTPKEAFDMFERGTLRQHLQDAFMDFVTLQVYMTFACGACKQGIQTSVLGVDEFTCWDYTCRS
jgi:hypothetical protein